MTFVGDCLFTSLIQNYLCFSLCFFVYTFLTLLFVSSIKELCIVNKFYLIQINMIFVIEVWLQWFLFSGFFLFFDYLLCYNLSVLFYQNIISAMDFMFCFVGLFYAFYFICAFCHIILLLDVNLLLFYHCLFLFTWPTLWVYDSRFLSVSKHWPKNYVISSESVSPMKEIGTRCERTISKVFKHAILN